MMLSDFLPEVVFPWYTGYLIITLLLFKYIFFHYLDAIGNRDENFKTRLLKYFNEADIANGRNYKKRHRNLSLVSSLILYPLMGLFLFAGWSADLERFGQAFFDNMLGALAVYTFVLLLVSTLLSVPESLYSVFKIEKEEGFNTTTISLWIKDLLKEFMIGLVLTYAVLALIMSIIRFFPDTWWLFGSIALGLFTLFMSFVAPIWLLPLFNKFTPLADPSLRSQVLSLAKRANMRIKDIYIMDASKRSKHSNAFFTGLGSSKRIVLYDTLLEKHSHEEILSILAHEMGHWRRGHIRKGMLISLITMVLAFYLFYTLFQYPPIMALFHIQTIHSPTFLLASLFLFQLLSIFYAPFMTAYSRKNEREADAQAMELYPNAEAQANVMIKLVSENKGDLLGHPWLYRLQASHPHPLYRIEFALSRKIVYETP